METKKKKLNTKLVNTLSSKTNTKRTKKNSKSSIKKSLKQKNVSSGKKAKGGRTTISPPAKIRDPKNSGVKVLASNIDTIDLSVDIVWKDTSFFAVLEEAQKLAKEDHSDYPVDFHINEELPDTYLFNIKDHGTNGYKWILLNKEYSLRIANREKPNARPSVLINVRSETLWRKGPYEAIYFILLFLKAQGGELREPKISRVDLCVDALVPTQLWQNNFLDYAVKRASATAIYQFHKKISGIQIGKSGIIARLYDKPLEIQQQSKKYWMFDVWGIEVVPENFLVIRTEFELKREAIKELGIHTLDILFETTSNIWAYCTKAWLKFQNNPGKQSHQRKTFSWWEEIQNGFNEMPSGHPVIRVKASNAETDALCRQVLGLLSSFAALKSQATDYFDYVPLELGTVMTAFYDTVIDNQLGDLEFKERVEKKKAKYERINSKMKDSLALRKDLGFI